MMPARLVQPWEALEMDRQDITVTSAKSNRRLLVVVDRASKLLACFPLPGEETLGVIRKLLELLLTFALPALDPLPPWTRVHFGGDATPLPMAPGAPLPCPE